MPTASSLQPSPLDDPATTAARREVILAKPLLLRFYRDAYRFFVETSREAPPGLRLEIGSGAGFLKSVMPDAITSDFLSVPGIDLVADGRADQ